MSQGDILISGFSNNSVNGIYRIQGLYNGRNYYHKENSNNYLMYFDTWMPWSNHFAYYIIEVFALPNSTEVVPIMVPKYKKISTDPLDPLAPWIAMTALDSGEYGTGEVIDEDSSSSSSESSSSSYGGLPKMFVARNYEIF